MYISHQIRTYMPELKEKFWRILFSVALLLLTVQRFGQQTSAARQLKATPFYQLYEWIATAAGSRLVPVAPFTSLAFSVVDPALWERLYVVVGMDILPLRPTAHLSGSTSSGQAFSAGNCSPPEWLCHGLSR